MAAIREQIDRHMSAFITDALIESKLVNNDSREAVRALINRTLSQVQSAHVSPSSDKIKTRAPRKRSAYNMFVKKYSAEIRGSLTTDTLKVKGAVLKEAGRRWKDLDAEARVPYQKSADEFNEREVILP